MTKVIVVVENMALEMTDHDYERLVNEFEETDFQAQMTFALWLLQRAKRSFKVKTGNITICDY